MNETTPIQHGDSIIVLDKDSRILLKFITMELTNESSSIIDGIVAAPLNEANKAMNLDLYGAPDATAPDTDGTKNEENVNRSNISGP